MRWVILAIVLSGCSSQWHLKKAIQKDPSILTEGVVIERVTDTIQVITPELRVDTVHAWSHDTVTTYVDRVRIRTKVDTVNRTVFVDVVCPPDTVYVEHTYDKTIIQPKVVKRMPWWVFILCLGIIISLLRRL
jgi:hypothetical protein